jgi:hypothetical protein
MRCVSIALVAACAFFMPSTARAQDTQAVRQEIEKLRSDFEALKREYGERLAALEAKLATAEPSTTPSVPAAPTTAAPGTTPPAGTEPTAPVPPGAAGAGGPAGALPVYGASVGGSKVFNPDIAVIGDFLGAAGPNHVAPVPALEMHESEASFQAVVDPYARADFFISFGQEGAEVEEGFVTFTSLPGGLLTKVGKMRAAFGKVNTLHNHVLPWADRPLVTQNLVGGEDGIDDAGISVARLIPNRWLFLEATGQVFRGTSGSVFTSYQRSDLSYVGHLRAYQDITEDSNIDIGASYARGTQTALANFADPNLKSQLFGIDATYRWRPLQRSIYNSFVGRTEWIWNRRDLAGNLGHDTPSGMYASADYQVARRWFAGGRFDRSAHATDSTLHDVGGSFVVTYWPSEFSQVRGQYRHTRYMLASDSFSSANELLFQFQFSIGAHGAHPF